MNFDFVDILTRAAQITWRNKILWLFSALPTAVSFLIFPVMFVPMFLSGGNSRMFESPVFLAVFVLGTIFVSVLSLALYMGGVSAVTFGIIRAASGEPALPVRELIQQSMRYIGRVVGVVLIFTFGFSSIFSAIFFMLALFGMVTAGIGFICVQPIIFLLYPVMMLAQGYFEQAQAAVVADDLAVTDALSKAWSLLKTNFWRLLLISLIIYFGISILTSIVLIPFMIPFFALPFFLQESMDSMRSFGFIMAAFGLIFLPVMVLVQGVTITYMKSAYVLIYLRLTRSSNLPVTVEAKA